MPQQDRSLPTLAQLSRDGFRKLTQQLDPQQSAWEAIEEAFSAHDRARNEVFAEAYRLRSDPHAFWRWLHKQAAFWVSEGKRSIEEAGNRWDFGRGYSSPDEWEGWEQDVVSAVDRLTRNYQTLKIPESLRGRTRRGPSDFQSLLKRYEAFRTKAQTFLREHPFAVGKIGPDQYVKLRLNFPEAAPEDLELLEQRRWGAFGEAVLARQEDCRPRTIHKYLIQARRATGRSRPQKRLA